MSIVEVRTAVGAPDEPHIQPGDLVSVTYVGGISFGRVFSVHPIEGATYVWWSGINTTTVDDGLMLHHTADLCFVERPEQYLAVVHHLSDHTRYAFVVVGSDVSEDEYAFEQARGYTIVSRRTRGMIDESRIVGDGADPAPGGVVESGESTIV